MSKIKSKLANRIVARLVRRIHSDQLRLLDLPLDVDLIRQKPLKSLRIVHISDLHFGTVQPHVVQSLVKAVNDQQPDLIIMSGDLTQRARLTEFEQCQVFLRQLQCKSVVAVAGNHDIMPWTTIVQRFTKPYVRYTSFLSDITQRLFQAPGLLVVGINSCNPFHYKNGWLLDDHLDMLEQLFTQCPPGTAKFLVAHHPFDAILQTDEHNIFPDAEFILHRLSKMGVSLVLGGHIHYPFARKLSIRYPGIKEFMGVCQAGTACSKRVRSGKLNSFMVLKLYQESEHVQDLKIEQWDLNPDTTQFEPMGQYYPCATLSS